MLATLAYAACEIQVRTGYDFIWRDDKIGLVRRGISSGYPINNIIRLTQNQADASFSSAYGYLAGDSVNINDVDFIATSIDQSGTVLHLGFFPSSGDLVLSIRGRLVKVLGVDFCYGLDKGALTSRDGRSAYILCGSRTTGWPPRDPLIPSFRTGLATGGEMTKLASQLAQVDLASGNTRTIARFYFEADTNFKYRVRDNALSRHGRQIRVRMGKVIYMFHEKLL